MTSTIAATPTTRTLDVPGATITYDVRQSAVPNAPVLLVIGSPMGASGFSALVPHIGDRTVVTYDPRGVERSTKTDPTSKNAATDTGPGRG